MVVHLAGKLHDLNQNDFFQQELMSKMIFTCLKRIFICPHVIIMDISYCVFWESDFISTKICNFSRKFTKIFLYYVQDILFQLYRSD